jgi:hypothetical protein
MVYEAKDVLPTDLQYGSPGFGLTNRTLQKKARKDAIDLLEESRDIAVIR